MGMRKFESDVFGNIAAPMNFPSFHRYLEFTLRKGEVCGAFRSEIGDPGLGVLQMVVS